jgi:ATP-dependent Clp protease ATP-binding subunit ClpA
MIEGRFTVESRRIIGRAPTLATELGHPAVGTEHLLLAMLEVPSIGAGVLARAGATAARVRTEVEDRTHFLGDEEALAMLGIDAVAVRDRINDAFGPGAFDTEPPWTELAQQVLFDATAAADVYACDQGLPEQERVVGTDWLFLALLERDEGIAAQVIEAVGVDPRQARRDIAEQIPVMTRFRHALAANPVHGRYRAVLATWFGLDDDRKAATAEVVASLHRHHDRAITDVTSRLFSPGADEHAVTAQYFGAISRPVEEASRAFATFGVAVS